MPRQSARNTEGLWWVKEVNSKRDDAMTEDVIVIPTHISGIKFLQNLLDSFRGFDKYPILIVINGYKKRDLKYFLEIKHKFKNLPITIRCSKGNNFNFGGLYCAYFNTEYNNIFLLPSSCEIVDTNLFDLVFEKHRDKSVAFGLIDHFWHSEVGKFRRSVLDKIDLPGYLPSNWMETCVTEVFFTTRYHSLDKDTVILFPDWVDCNVFEEKFGKLRMKIANEYIIKWKAHWSMDMILEHIKKENPLLYLLYRFKLGLFDGSYNELLKHLCGKMMMARHARGGRIAN